MGNPFDQFDKRANPFDQFHVVASTPGTGPKPPSGFKATATGMAPVSGGPEDPAFSARKAAAEAAARAGASTPIEVAGQIAAARARAQIETAAAIERTRRENQLPPNKNQTFDNTSGLRKELESQSAVKIYKNAMPSYASALQSPDTPAGDLDMIYAFAKIMDPDSVVREGEANSVAALGTVGQRIYGELRKQLDGAGRLSPEQRSGMRQTLAARVTQYNRAYTLERSRFRDLATKQGVDPDLVVGPHFGDAYAEVENKYFRGDPHKGPRAAQQEEAANAALQQAGFPGAGGGGGNTPPGSPPSGGSGPQAPLSPQEFQGRLADMLRTQRPESEILDFVKKNGSTLNARDQGVLRDYETARSAGQPTQVDVRVGPETSTTGGLIAGAVKPLDRAAQGLEAGYNWLTGGNSHEAADIARGRDAALTSTFGPLNPTAKTVGEIAGTLPLAYLPGGPVAQGAAANLLTSNSDTASGLVRDAVVGGALGKAGDLAVRGVAGLIAPELRQSVTNLSADKVRLTPGRMFGGRFANMEDRATSLPLAGPRIRESQAQALGDFQLARAGETLGEVGERLPAGIEPGQPAVKYTRSRLSDRYNDTTSQISAALDPTFQTRLNALPRIAERQGLPADQLNELNTIIQRDVGGAFTPRRGMFGGREYKRLDERLGDLSTSYKASDDPYQRQLGDFVGTLNDQVGALVRRQNPAQAADLRALDRGWAKFSRLRDATGRDVDEGIPTLGQWQTAVRTGDKSIGKGRTAEGDALFQTPVSDASEVLGSKFGNSGTADRENLTDWKAWLAGAALSPLYSETAQRGLQSVLTSSRPAAAKPIAELLKSLPASTVAPLLFAPRY